MDLPAAVGRVAGTAFLLLGLAVVGGLSPGPFDVDVNAAVADMPSRARAAWDEVSDIITYGTAGGAAFLASGTVVQQRRWDRLALIGLAVTASVANGLILKPAFALERPATAFAASAAFPSGHTTTALLLVGTLLIARPPTLRAPAGGRLAFVAAVALAAGVARVLGGAHWPIDVLGAWAYGTAVLGVLVHAATDPGAWDRPRAITRA